MGDDTMMPISANVRAVPRSGIRDVFDRVIGIDDVISLCVGEPSRTAAPHVVEAAAEAAREARLGIAISSAFRNFARPRRTIHAA